MSILGLISGKTLADAGFNGANDRRRVFYQFPNGAAPLTGLLSLMDDDFTDNPEFGWNEDRYRQVQTTVAPRATSNAPFCTTGTTTAISSPSDIAKATVIRVYLADTTGIEVGQLVEIKDVPITDSLGDIQGLVTSVVSSVAIEIELNEAIAGLINTTNLTTGVTAGPIGAVLHVIGSSVEEGADLGALTGMEWPVTARNYCQIIRTPFGFTSTALKQPQKFDKTGVYKSKAKKALLKHMVDLEKAFMFGTRRIKNVTETTGEIVPQRMTGGVRQFLKDWEAAYSPYRGGDGVSTGPAAVTDIASEDKRIIRIATTGSTTWAAYKGYLARLFRVTNNVASEKLCLCGSGHIAAIDALIENKVATNKNMPSESTYGMNIRTIETIHGTVHYKVHPLFNQIPHLLYTGFYLDVQNLAYRPLNDRDTTLLKLRQNPGADRRVDEFLTEAGLECRFPESHMIIENLKTITVS